ncbi:hypothetical protein PUN28_002912 [Cardiocondyla obscurior]|uniref:Uncharacterized protein n=1 Tax=Cardiocondyla obscurior TaxID=286306 RepID=A0AAW2GWP9_9HYME
MQENVGLSLAGEDAARGEEAGDRGESKPVAARPARRVRARSDRWRREREKRLRERNTEQYVQRETSGFSALGGHDGWRW